MSRRPSRRPFAEQGIELAGAFERVQIVAAADMDGPDEDLRHGHAPIRSLDHFGAAPRASADIDLVVIDALALQQGFGSNAIRTIARRVNLDGGHGGSEN